MRVRFVHAVLLVWILCPVTIPADEQGPSNSREGITTQQNLQDSRKAGPVDSQSPLKKASAGKKASVATIQNDNRSQAINWSGEEQKKRCNGYLEDLRALFLKTRHYAIQGASCDTAANAAAFLKSMETCKQNCPQGLLEHNGYTERIIRNIEHLGKLGNDRCNGSPTPVPQETQTP